MSTRVVAILMTLALLAAPAMADTLLIQGGTLYRKRRRADLWREIGRS